MSEKKTTLKTSVEESHSHVLPSSKAEGYHCSHTANARRYCCWPLHSSGINALQFDIYIHKGILVFKLSLEQWTLTWLTIKSQNATIHACMVLLQTTVGLLSAAGRGVSSCDFFFPLLRWKSAYRSISATCWSGVWTKEQAFLFYFL